MQHILNVQCPKHAEWRWGNLHAVLRYILRAEPILRGCWDPVKFRAAGEVGSRPARRNDDAADDPDGERLDISAVTKAIRDGRFWAYAAMVEVLHTWVASVSSWAEGCACHDWLAPTSSCKPLRYSMAADELTAIRHALGLDGLRRAAAAEAEDKAGPADGIKYSLCPMAGKRALDLATCRLEDIFHRIGEPHLEEVCQCCVGLSAEDLSLVYDDFNLGQAHMLQAKFGLIARWLDMMVGNAHDHTIESSPIPNSLPPHHTQSPYHLHFSLPHQPDINTSSTRNLPNYPNPLTPTHLSHSTLLPLPYLLPPTPHPAPVPQPSTTFSTGIYIASIPQPPIPAPPTGTSTRPFFQPHTLLGLNPTDPHFPSPIPDRALKLRLEIAKLKLAQWKVIPWRLVQLADPDESKHAGIAKSLISEFDNSPCADKHHRISLFWLQKGSALRADIESLAAGQPMRELPLLSRHAAALLFLPTAERRQEGDHSIVSHLRNHPGGRHGPYVSLALRLQELEEKFSTRAGQLECTDLYLQMQKPRAMAVHLGLQNHPLWLKALENKPRQRDLIIILQCILYSLDSESQFALLTKARKKREKHAKLAKDRAHGAVPKPKWNQEASSK